MKTLNAIQSNPKTNVWGSLGSRNRIPAPVNVSFNKGVIFCVTSRQAIYSDGKFNEVIDITELSEEVLCQILKQL